MVSKTSVGPRFLFLLATSLLHLPSHILVSRATRTQPSNSGHILPPSECVVADFSFQVARCTPQYSELISTRRSSDASTSSARARPPRLVSSSPPALLVSPVRTSCPHPDFVRADVRHSTLSSAASSGGHSAGCRAVNQVAYTELESVERVS
ncbi:uncharacterized protein B0H18DRAFT_1007328 [Fomitopsis serialis]|uniref:uncharacterized protein n=1 Tax=Fomitopsis serialis TaxID=139415 RepID=UPI002008B062|nr:uncharacterized protein B0H18DRAFT_1007328 [Neoantrodia serialis]KAH9925991.1 hypothetical protein B0H18DRAFT_1007328 [Neoantrodia serialis]